MDKAKMMIWKGMVKEIEAKIARMEDQDIEEGLFMGLPNILLAIEHGDDSEVIKDGKGLFIKMIDKLDTLGVHLRTSSNYHAQYLAYKDELGVAVDEKVKSPLALAFENLTFDKIMSAPKVVDAPNN